MKPISIIKLSHIIDTIHLEYPLLNKYEISLITLTFFDVIRELFVEERNLSISQFMNNFHMIKFKRNTYDNISAKLSTPKSLK